MRVLASAVALLIASQVPATPQGRALDALEVALLQHGSPLFVYADAVVLHQPSAVELEAYLRLSKQGGSSYATLCGLVAFVWDLYGTPATADQQRSDLYGRLPGRIRRSVVGELPDMAFMPSNVSLYDFGRVKAEGVIALGQARILARNVKALEETSARTMLAGLVEGEYASRLGSSDLSTVCRVVASPSHGIDASKVMRDGRPWSDGFLHSKGLELQYASGPVLTNVICVLNVETTGTVTTLFPGQQAVIHADESGMQSAMFVSQNILVTISRRMYAYLPELAPDKSLYLWCGDDLMVGSIERMSVDLYSDQGLVRGIEGFFGSEAEKARVVEELLPRDPGSVARTSIDDEEEGMVYPESWVGSWNVTLHQYLGGQELKSTPGTVSVREVESVGELVLGLRGEAEWRVQGRASVACEWTGLLDLSRSVLLMSESKLSVPSKGEGVLPFTHPFVPGRYIARVDRETRALEKGSWQAMLPPFAYATCEGSWSSGPQHDGEEEAGGQLTDWRLLCGNLSDPVSIAGMTVLRSPSYGDLAHLSGAQVASIAELAESSLEVLGLRGALMREARVRSESISEAAAARRVRGLVDVWAGISGDTKKYALGEVWRNLQGDRERWEEAVSHARLEDIEAYWRQQRRDGLKGVAAEVAQSAEQIAPDISYSLVRDSSGICALRLTNRTGRDLAGCLIVAELEVDQDKALVAAKEEADKMRVRFDGFDFEAGNEGDLFQLWWQRMLIDDGYACFLEEWRDGRSVEVGLGLARVIRGFSSGARVSVFAENARTIVELDLGRLRRKLE